MRPRPLTSAAGTSGSTTIMLPPGKATTTVDDHLFQQYSRLLACQPTGWLSRQSTRLRIMEQVHTCKCKSESKSLNCLEQLVRPQTSESQPGAVPGPTSPNT